MESVCDVKLQSCLKGRRISGDSALQNRRDGMYSGVLMSHAGIAEHCGTGFGRPYNGIQTILMRAKEVLIVIAGGRIDKQEQNIKLTANKKRCYRFVFPNITFL